VPGREIAEMMQARGVIETWAATTSLMSGDAPVAAMSAVLEQQRSIVDNGDAKEFIELDSQFHALLVEAAGNSVLGRLYDNLRAKHVLLGQAGGGRESDPQPPRLHRLAAHAGLTIRASSSTARPSRRPTSVIEHATTMYAAIT
jgi:DNA-binding GntR family transcriptional regulator